MAKRRSTPRSKSGCRTCKIRRVKCDEQQPACRRCTDTGRTCDGYGVWGQSRPKTLTACLVYPPQTLPGLAQDERRYLDRFRVLLTDKLTRPFGSRFWSSLVLQMSQSEPAVLHASIALTSAYDAFAPAQIQDTVSSITPTPFLLRQYNRAIQALVSNASLNDAVSVRVAAVSCILFICLEILRGDVNAMEVHFASGIKLLHQLQEQNRRLKTMDDKVLVKHTPEVFDDHLVDVFARLNLQFLMLGHGSQQKDAFVPSFQYGRGSHLARRFCSVEEARQSIIPTLLAIVYLVKEIERVTLTSSIQPPPLTAAMFEKREALQAAIDDWIASYNHSFTSNSASTPSLGRLGLLMLRTYADVATILLDTCTSVKETAYDVHQAAFERIIARYRNIHSTDYPLASDTCESDPTFMIDMGLFPPLYFTALKCRNHQTRHEALSILRQYVHMEGPWTGPMLARVAGHAVYLEERQFEAELAKTVSEAVVLPEFCRLHCAECHLPDRRDQGSNTASLILRRFRHELGNKGGWEVESCTVDLSSSSSSPSTASTMTFWCE
ncbi:hypothetical protein BDW74DRAFT_182730 [Aspergillus multicolor]|uniref:Zn(II)2Cys6 transcription factor domain-containing protein n=1 Tax=Aspergillus multicolor TaxID=41759 RepID=UPI003CCD4276